MTLIEPFAALHRQAAELGFPPPDVILAPEHYDHLLSVLSPRMAGRFTRACFVEIYGIKVWRGTMETTGGGGDVRARSRVITPGKVARRFVSARLPAMTTEERIVQSAAAGVSVRELAAEHGLPEPEILAILDRAAGQRFFGESLRRQLLLEAERLSRLEEHSKKTPSFAREEAST